MDVRTGLACLVAVAACGGAVDVNETGGTGGAGAVAATGSGSGTTGSGVGGSSTSTTTSTSTSTTGTGGMSMGLGCFQTPPPNSPQPAPLVDSGNCPTLKAGTNAIPVGNGMRDVLIAVPKDLQPSESLPVVFLWHWLGGSAQNFLDKADVQSAVDHYRFVAVSMVAKGDVPQGLKWPFMQAGTPVVGVSDARVQEEYGYFDKALACVAKNFNVNRHCVSSVGVSAGALWTQVLASGRGEYLASFLSLSGGEGQFFVRPWKSSARKMPAMVLWGGPMDACANLFNFQTLSKSLEGKLAADGHFLLECVHNCQHSVPPFEPLPSSATQFGVLWEFALDHPDWLPAGVSPWKTNGLPAGFPGWCAIGAGKATIRTGPCPNPPGC
jgi:predicted esterase